MGYYVRCFCTGTRVPTLREALAAVARDYPQLEVGSGSAPVDLDTPAWRSALLRYKSGKAPIDVDLNRVDGEDTMPADEIAEFIEMVEAEDESTAQKQVLDHLRKTTFTVACQLPTSDIDDDGYNANALFLQHFVDHCAGMIQADGEGFYEGDRVVLQLA